jgi:hypothetical protein
MAYRDGQIFADQSACLEKFVWQKHYVETARRAASPLKRERKAARGGRNGGKAHFTREFDFAESRDVGVSPSA